MDRKVIWVLNQTAGKLDSGWGERHYFLSKKWIEEGYKVKIISGSYNHLFVNQPKVSSNTFTIEKINDGLDFCWVKVPKYKGGSVFKFWSNLIFALKICFLTSSKIESPSAIIVSSMPIFSILSGIYLKRKLKAEKLIFEIRDLWPLTPIHLSNYSEYNPFVIILKWIEKVGYKNSDFIVSVLPKANTYIDNISGEPTKYKYIPNGLDEELLGKDYLDNEIVNTIPKNKFVIGYTGTIGMANAMDCFFETVIKLKDDERFHFVVVGEGYLKEKYIKDTIGCNNITFIDKISKSKVQHMLSFLKICYLSRLDNPLYKYGVSYNKYFDYMIAKKLILESSNNIASPGSMSKCSIIVKPESSEAIIKELNLLFDKPLNYFEEIGEKGYNFVKKYHNFDYLSSEYLKLF
ncbi:glycosyltransferase family 4 protein [Lutibacter sp. TH_r2]|uniref:glycosyltransferase family 4 protein n=1 Tax=Lutibacter sp. TH_r2 TaxID=3082083 RepID=UPI002955308A|nr:glycosyltransferase family 4 protein [Lutibacter sp. TH_r2]MDV7187461.1 glycosyltransferase family 4 protein [Lutibacter sp. TH_r2]